MPPAQKNATGKDEYVYSDDSFDESYHSDGDIGRNNRRGAASSTLSKSPAPRTNFNSHITSANSYIHTNTNYRSYNFKSNTNNKGKKRKNSQLSFLPPNVKDDTLRQWCHEQITRRKTLQNKIGELSRRLEELTEENRDLRKQVRFGEKSLQKMERDQKNMPFVLREHSADIRRLRKNMDEEHKSKEDLEKRNKKISEELVRMRDENRDLKRIINDKDLMKKQYERGMFEDLESKAQLAEENNKKREDDFRNMEKNHKSEVNRLNIKVRNLTSEKEDLENAMKELESKLQEKDKELAIHYIYAQRLTKPPPRLSNTPPKVLTNKHVMTDPDSVLEGVKRDNLLLKQEVHNLRGQLEKFGATAKFLDEEKEKLEKEQQERERKEREFQEEMEKSRQAAEAEEKRRREELEAEAEQDRIRREEEAERKKIEEQDRVERERIEWEKTQRRKIEEEKMKSPKSGAPAEEQEDWFLKLLAEKGAPTANTATSQRSVKITSPKRVRGASDGNQGQQSLQSGAKLEAELEQMQKQRQKLLEAEEEAKKEQLLNKLKNIEAKQSNHASSFSFTPSTPVPKSYNREPVGQYSRQNSTNNHDYRTNLKTSHNNFSNDGFSREPSMKREDTEAQLAAILGSDLRSNRGRRKKDTQLAKEDNNLDSFFDQSIVDSNRNSRSRQKSQQNVSSSPFYLDRQKSDRNAIKTHNQTPMFQNRSPVIHDDIEELLL